MIWMENRVRTVHFAAAVIALCLVCVSAATACSPVPGDFWYTITIELEAKTLPRGIEISRSPHATKLQNVSEKPFEIYGALEPADLAARKGIRFRGSQRPLYRLAGGFVDAYPPLPGDPGVASWRYRQYFYGCATQDANWLDFRCIVGDAKNVMQDNRPPSVEVPAVRGFVIDATMGGRYAPIRGAIVYRLNESYVSDLGAQSASACERSWIR